MFAVVTDNRSRLPEIDEDRITPADHDRVAGAKGRRVESRARCCRCGVVIQATYPFQLSDPGGEGS
jgi:hypothetical protein